METIYISFYVCGIVLIVLSVVFLVKQYRTAGGKETDELCPSLENWPLHNIAVFMIGLVTNGYILKHILTNTALEHDDKNYCDSFIGFLSAANIASIKKTKGSVKNVWD
jgi:hypothetical protein